MISFSSVCDLGRLRRRKGNLFPGEKGSLYNSLQKAFSFLPFVGPAVISIIIETKKHKLVKQPVLSQGVNSEST
jgi:hypothetical protein